MFSNEHQEKAHNLARLRMGGGAHCTSRKIFSPKWEGIGGLFCRSYSSVSIIASLLFKFFEFAQLNYYGIHSTGENLLLEFFSNLRMLILDLVIFKTYGGKLFNDNV